MLFKKKKEENNLDIDETTYEEYEEPQIIINNENLEETNNINNNKSINRSRNKIYKFILIILAIIFLVLIGYTVLNAKYTSYSIKFNLTSFGIIKNDNYQINYLCKPDNNIKFSVDNKNIINVNPNNGYISSRNIGESTIKASARNKVLNTPLKVYVVNKRIPIENIVVVDMTMKKNSQDIIVITPVPENTTEINFQYKSSNPNIVSVNEKGIITSHEKGSAFINITNNEIKKTILVTVK